MVTYRKQKVKKVDKLNKSEYFISLPYCYYDLFLFIQIIRLKNKISQQSQKIIF